jgi:hypothetical protein
MDLKNQKRYGIEEALRMIDYIETNKDNICIFKTVEELLIDVEITLTRNIFMDKEYYEGKKDTYIRYLSTKDTSISMIDVVCSDCASEL